MREFEQKKREWEDQAEAKTAKNRAKRQKKKERSKGKGNKDKDGGGSGDEGRTLDTPSSAPLKKRRLVNGKELVFKRPGEDSDDEGAYPDNGSTDIGPAVPLQQEPQPAPIPVVETPRITIIEDN